MICTSGSVSWVTPSLGTMPTVICWCSIRCWPTFGWFSTTLTPNPSRSAFGPMPDRSRMVGVFTAPADRVMCSPYTVCVSVPIVTSTPIAREPSNTTRFTRHCGRTVRFSRCWAWDRYATAVETRRFPRRFIGIGPTPELCGSLWSAT